MLVVELEEIEVLLADVDAMLDVAETDVDVERVVSSTDDDVDETAAVGLKLVFSFEEPVDSVVLTLVTSANDGVVAEELVADACDVVVCCAIVAKVVEAMDVVDCVGEVAIFVVALVDPRGDDGGVDGELLGETFVGNTVGVVGAGTSVLLLSGAVEVNVADVVTINVEVVDDDDDNGMLEGFIDEASVAD